VRFRWPRVDGVLLRQEPKYEDDAVEHADSAAEASETRKKRFVKPIEEMRGRSMQTRKKKGL
jgi:hypothetical protein